MSSSPPPKRRFLPEPVETTTKSSRRFVPEPVETTTKSSRRFVPEPVETTTRSSRKFAPEPVETTTRSSRKFAVEPVETTTRSVKKFAPEPVETTTRSSKDKASAADATPRRRFAPQPVETTTRSNRAGAENGANGVNGSDTRSADASLSDAQASPQIDAAPQAPKPRRKFAPQLIETAKRTRKSGDAGPAVGHADRTEATTSGGATKRQRPPLCTLPPANTPPNPLSHVPSIIEARRLGMPVRSDSIGSNRSHSFRVPVLDTIESSESEEEGTPSLSTTPSAISDSERSFGFNHATRRRESVDERFSGYLLAIAAKAAEKQMREQAMAAFPNDDYHETVDHFIAHEEEDTEGEPMEGVIEERRESFTKVNWELLAMRKYREENTDEDPAGGATEKTKKAAEPTKKNIWGEPQWGAPSKKNQWEDASTTGPWGDPYANQRGRPEEREMQGMQRGARPPMLGSDITFPRCPSPEPARFDVTQGSEALRNSMCYLTEQSQPEPHQGLWRSDKKEEPPKVQLVKEPEIIKFDRSRPPTLWSNPGSRPPSPGGLWNGYCRGPGSRENTNKQAGMLTPHIEIDNPFDSPPPTPARAPPSPPPSNPDMASIDDKLAAQQALEEEFSDAFVTQVYNYLSLGYPSLARKFDDELSKISRIPIDELRQDDELAQARGYIRLGDDNNVKDVGITEDTCMRWRALRVYIYEWAKQQPRFLHAGHALGGFGVGARRGSWAW